MKPKMILAQPKHRAVLNHRAFIFAQTTIRRLSDGAFRRIAGDHAVDQFHASLPRTSYLYSGETSIRPAVLRIA